jgi:AcrR family transcriptional regulator
MASKKSRRPSKRSYHHGDLQRALREAAWRLVRTQGLEALTFRELARQLGVTHAAPYHHFADREALLEAMAEEGFLALEAATASAVADVPDPGERLFLCGQCYIDYARAHPERMQVMFRRHPPPAPLIDPQSAGARVFAYLFAAVSDCQRAGLAPAGAAPWDLALHAWSVVHGFSKLWVEGPVEELPPYAQRFEELRDQILRNFGEGWRAQAREQAKSGQ